MKLNFTYISEDHKKKVSLEAGESFYRESETAYRDIQRDILDDIICQIKTGVPWREVVRIHFEQNNKWLYNIITHPNRDLFFRLNPVLTEAEVLDIGSGWGQIALRLAAAGCSVCALEPTLERLNFIRAAATQENLIKNMFFTGCDYQDVEFHNKFDVITCVGVLEWSGKLRNKEDAQSEQQEFLRKIRLDLKEGGYCVIGIENRFGLKYWLGAAGDHTGVSSIEILDAHLAKERWRQKTGLDLKTFIYTMAEYRKMLQTAGFTEINFFAAFPDYKLPQYIVPSDNAEEINIFFGMNEFVPEHDGSNGAALSDEIQQSLISHYRSLAEMGIMHFFAPSYFIRAS